MILRPLNVLIVGCGAIAGGYDSNRPDGALPRSHAPAYLQAGGFRLAACIDPDVERRQAFRTRWGVAHAAASIDEAAMAGPFDVVSICSPTALHAEHVAQALALKPRALFLEKPVTPRLADSVRLVELVERAGVSLAVNHTRRWAPDVRQLADELAAGHWGRVRSVATCYTKGVLNNGSHLFDLLHLLLGPVKVLATGAPRADHDPQDPSIACLLQVADEVPVAVSIGHARDYALFEMTLVTERGTIAMEDGGLGWRVRRCVDSPTFPGYRALDAGDVRPGRYEEAMLAAMNGLRRHLLEGQPLACTGRDALAAQAVSHAIREAAGLSGG